MGRHEAAVRKRRSGGAEEPRVAVIIAALLLTVLVAALNQTVVATAMPRIVSDLGGLSHISWVVTSYLLAVTACTPLWGKLGDQFGRKWVLLVCLAVFLAGSALCGLAGGFGTLVAYRAVQGIGGGGLMVLAQAAIGDIVPPRRRGSFMGLFGAVFGVASVAGPLIGGFIVDNLSWRWVFYVNLPLGVAAFLVLIAALPATRGTARTRVDYAGILLLAAASVCAVLVTSLGGTAYGWLSVQVIGLIAATVLLAVLWWAAARRADDPVMPLSLFRSPVIVASAAISFAVGFAMMGSMAYIPLFLQVVHGYSPTSSGLHLLPMVAGMLVCSIASGQLLTRTGRYRIYPIIGSALVALALFLMSGLEPDTPFPVLGGYLLLLGSGLGLTMQVIVVAAQNAADYRDLGAATSAATFFRSIGGSIGTSVFGAVFAAQLAANIAERMAGVALPPGADPRELQNDPSGLAELPPEARAEFLGAYADSVDAVFLSAVPLALAAFVVALFLKQIPLRTTIGPPDLDEVVAPVRTDRTAVAELERAVYRAFGREGARHAYLRLAEEAGLELSPGACWTVTHLAATGPIGAEELSRMSHGTVEQDESVHRELLRAGLLRDASPTWELNPQGRDAARRLREAQERTLRGLLREYGPADHPELNAALHDLARSCLGDEEDAGLVREGGDERRL
ncbi:MFS transporter [Nocardiopsis sp. CNT-189]|uniref:MDR family MFS transporter n=1 Tax=Nocardiopsis oceanisediminis TaxID=2816862 RepID=UPI003B31BB39